MKNQHQFVICIKNEGCEDLILHKIYQVLPDATAAREGYWRVVDESGEDYLYPQACFLSVELPQVVENALLVSAVA